MDNENLKLSESADTDTSKEQLREQVASIAAMLENGFDEDDLNVDGEPMSAMDYIFEALDIEYQISSDRQYLGANICVAFGGPSIYIDTRKCCVEGYWWGDTCRKYYTDNVGLDDAARELFECGG